MTIVTAAISGRLTATVAAAATVVPAFSWDQLNPVVVMANLVAVGTTSVWQSIMTNIWSAGLWLTGFVFQLVDAFTAPDLSGGGLMSKIYPFTFGIGAGLALILALVQVGFAAWQRDGKGLARLVVGVFQFMLVWGGMVGVGAALNVATAGLTQGMLQVAFGAPSFAKANLLQQWNIRQSVDATTATVLGVCGLFLVFAAIGYLLVMLVRSAALMILMATSPISAAGLLSEGTRSWFWKSLRWFLAALMIGPLAALVLAIGKLLTDGLLSGAGESTQSAVGTAVVGTMLIIMGAFCPLILFRLLAFVDPGTSSGASFRASLDSAGGVGGLLQGGGAAGGAAAGGGDSGAATSQASNGTSQGEADAGNTTQGRLTSALSSLGGATGTAFGMGANKLASAGNAAATYGADILGAAGVGHQQPYFGTTGSGNQQQSQNQRDRGDSKPSDPNTTDGTGGTGGAGGAEDSPAVAPATPTPTPSTPPSPTSPGGQPGGGGGGAGGGKSGGTGGGAGAGSAGGAGGAAGGVEGAAAVAAL